MARRLLAALCLLAACAQPAPPGSLGWVGDRHARDAAAPVAQPLGVVEAERRLDAAIAVQRDRGGQGAPTVAGAAGDDVAASIVRLCNRVAAAGRVIDSERRLAAETAIDRLGPTTLAQLFDELEQTHYPAAHVALRLALIARHEERDDEARRWIELAGRAPDDIVGERLAALRAELDARAAVDPRRIAVLLPLSGGYGRLGKALRTAIEVAHGAAGAGAELVFLDTAGDERRAEAAVERAARELGAVAILGPVGQKESRAAARRAAILGVPIALLAPADDGASADAGVFRMVPSAAWEARRAAEVAVQHGYDRLAVLAPRDELGAAASDAFAAAARRLGAEVVATGAYDPTASDLEPDIKRFLSLDPRDNARLRAHLRRHGKRGWKTFTPDVRFDLLYIPDDYDRAALVVAYLPYFNVELRSQDFVDIEWLRRKHGGRVPQVVQLLGSSGWHHPGMLPRGGPAIDGALVLDVWSGSDVEEYATDAAVRFAEAYRRRAGHPPGATLAQAHDAALMVLEARAAVTARGPAARDDLRRRLAGAQLREGAAGAATMARDGTVDRPVIVLRVDGDAFLIHRY